MQITMNCLGCNQRKTIEQSGYIPERYCTDCKPILNTRRNSVEPENTVRKTELYKEDK